jgi:hypothetical protein
MAGKRAVALEGVAPAEMATAHMTILVVCRELAEVHPQLEHPGRTASHNNLVVRVTPACLEEAAVLRFPRSSLRIVIIDTQYA